MQSNLVEKVNIKAAHCPITIVSETVTFGNHIDTAGFDSAVIALSVAPFSAPATLSAILYEQEANNGDLTLVPVTGGNLGLITGNDAVQNFIGGIEVKNYKRYLALRLQGSLSRTANPTIGVAAAIILGKADVEPVSNSAVFDVK
jgi:hypothetical protein